MNLEQRLIEDLKRRPRNLSDLAAKYKCKVSDLNAIVKDLKIRGMFLIKRDGNWSIDKNHPPRDYGNKFKYVSRPDNSFKFGFIGDTHLGSKYERLDVLNDLYDIFELEEVDRVFHAGNWIDGECRLNQHDLNVHGMDGQCRYLARIYPKKEFITYAVTGDDHEGWWAHSQGIDIGFHMENVMKAENRLDWINVGYMESFIPLKNVNSGKVSQLLLIHPGGGSAYATSYRPQKIVESLQGGEKPGVLLIGHYHKLSYNLIRGVNTIQVGCTEDQTPFMRKKGIDAHVGGGICTLKQDPASGSIYSCTVQFLQYFNKGYYNNRWGYSGLEVNLPERKINVS